MIPEPPTDLNGNWDPKTTKAGEDDYTHVFRIITAGVDKSEYMGSFANLSRFERWSLAKYVMSFRAPGDAGAQQPHMPKK